MNAQDGTLRGGDVSPHEISAEVGLAASGFGFKRLDPPPHPDCKLLNPHEKLLETLV